MSYEKPELLVLSHAAKAVRNVSDARKSHITAESGTSDGVGTPDSGNDLAATSSTSGAYESDE